ncbi:LOW QUALITY PROTEIN: inositol 1,4,5-trisphosphate receptor-interacting protein-like 1 [Morphnus guianensis]
MQGQGGRAQERAIPLCRKSSKRGRRLAWLSRSLLWELRRPTGAYGLWRGIWGVLVGGKLSRSQQRAPAAQRASHLLGRVRHSRASRWKEGIDPPRSGGVRPHLAYCVQLWAPQCKQDADGVLLLLFGLCCGLRKRSHEVDSSSDEESSSNDREQVEEEVEEDGSEDDLGRFFEEHIQWPVQNLARDCQVVEDLIGNFILVFREISANSFFPVLQPAIGVGSAFEGWSPREEDIIRLLVPLKPPSGHAFHLELGKRGETPAWDSCVRVELVCMRREQLAGDMLCFLHHPEEDLRRNQGPSLLRTFCAGSYLDVQKTAHWFYQLVQAAWVVLSQSSTWHLTMLPSSCSCKFQVTEGNNKSHIIEVMFGVQQGNSDIFVSSQNTEAIFTPSTTWPERYAVAEVKFFRHMARQVPHDSFHLRCLQAYARILVDIGFSTYTLKTVVMHLLNTIPLSGWRRRHFVLRMEDIMQYLRHCLEEKRLDHFFLGNERVPEEIILPPAFQTAEPLNLFQHLVQDPVAHAEAMREYRDL